MEKSNLSAGVFGLSYDKIDKLIEQHDTPLFIIIRERLIDNYQAFRSFFPGVEVYYALKANPHPYIIQVLGEIGSSFDVASLQEIQLVLSHGISPQRMIFANTIKRKKGIRFAKDSGVSRLTYDNFDEIGKMARVFQGASVILRIKTPSVGSRINLSYKFGAEPNEALDLLLKAQDAGLNPIGISFHVGSPCTNVENYIASLKLVVEIFEQAASKGIHLHTIDIGGGFPLQVYQTKNIKVSVESMGKILTPLLLEYFGRDCTFVAEPGRSLVGSAGLLISKVIGRAKRSGKNWYYLDDGYYGTFTAIPFDKSVFEFYTFKDESEKYPCILAGPTCDSVDIIADGVLMPEMQLDDLVFVPNIGAYSWASATTFNGFEKPKVILA
ncbi:type III PLP-dependent enzyme [Atribacter laminatus]|uniref:ornithine decarboxylase n=1 Tax=Atribacter laminatus TaxID=2847778 RepID=A0A7T1F1X0_ATRLM|nr:type III PLP-dependent enzyme [Atribacter laminatus]QPM67185.1 Lysine/ornithine decarboxylase [Atribacter laminatus]